MNNNQSSQSPPATHGQAPSAGGISGLLNSNKQQKPIDDSPATIEMQKEISMMSRKIRINEERSMNIRKKTQMIEHNIISNHKKTLTEMRYINEEIAEIKQNIISIKSKLATFTHELNEAAKKEDVDVLNRYINIWEPINFVTRKEVERIINDLLEDKGILKEEELKINKEKV